MANLLHSFPKTTESYLSIRILTSPFYVYNCSKHRVIGDILNMESSTDGSPYFIMTCSRLNML